MQFYIRFFKVFELKYLSLLKVFQILMQIIEIYGIYMQNANSRCRMCGMYE